MIFIGLVNCQYLLSFCCTSSKTALANSTKSFTQGSSSSPPKFSINHWILAFSFSVGTKYRPGMSGISPFQARGTPSSKILHRLPVPIGPHGPVESPSISRIPGELLSHTILKCTRLHQPGSPGRSSSLRPGWEARPSGGLPRLVCIPRPSGRSFDGDPATHSTHLRPLNPRPSGHPGR